MKRLSFLALVTLASCATVPTGGVGPTAALGGTAAVGEIRIRPVELLEDSRCPAQVQCIWAGQVRVLVDVHRGDGAHQQRDLTLGKAQDIDWGTLTLVDVQPAKLAAGATDPRAYQFTFAFVRR